MHNHLLISNVRFLHLIHLFVVVKTLYYVNLILIFYGHFTIQDVTRNIGVVSKECCYPNNMYFYSNVKISGNNFWTDDLKNDIVFFPQEWIQGYEG